MKTPTQQIQAARQRMADRIMELYDERPAIRRPLFRVHLDMVLMHTTLVELDSLLAMIDAGRAETEEHGDREVGRQDNEPPSHGLPEAFCTTNTKYGGGEGGGDA